MDSRIILPGFPGAAAGNCHRHHGQSAAPGPDFVSRPQDAVPVHQTIEPTTTLSQHTLVQKTSEQQESGS